MKAYHNLTAAINGIRNTKSDAHLEALQQIEQNLALGNQRVIEGGSGRRARVQRQAEQEPSQSPRVQFAERKIVTSPTEAVVETTPPTGQRPAKQVTPILKKSKFVESGSIAERVKACHNTQNQSPAEPELSIAEQVATRCHQTEQANPVLYHETGKILEYRELLRHPKFKEV